jgi:hypothetical protein
MSKSFKIEQFPFLKYYAKPLSFMFWQDLKQRFDKFFKYFEVKRDSRVAFVIRVDLRSKVVSVVILEVEKYL